MIENPPDSAEPMVALVVFGGADADLAQLAQLSANAEFVVAADSGAHYAVAAGIEIDLLVGDLDSIDPVVLADIEKAGARVERHRIDKDATDLELAINAAVVHGATKIFVVGGHGGRVDHSVANFLIITSPALAHVEIHAVIDSAQVSVVHGGCATTFKGAPGDVVTILPLHGDAHGIRTVGLEYPLNGDMLVTGTTRGVSNVMLDTQATVSLESGVIAVVRPATDFPQQGMEK